MTKIYSICFIFVFLFKLELLKREGGDYRHELNEKKRLSPLSSRLKIHIFEVTFIEPPDTCSTTERIFFNPRYEWMHSEYCHLLPISYLTPGIAVSGKNLLIVFDRFRLNELRKLQKLKSSDNMFRTFQTSSDLWRTHYGRLRGWSWAQCILSLGMTPVNPGWEL